jgi:hypothetical protein
VGKKKSNLGQATGQAELVWGAAALVAGVVLTSLALHFTRDLRGIKGGTSSKLAGKNASFVSDKPHTSGPWGWLEYEKFGLGDDWDFIAMSPVHRETHWYFPNYTASKLEELFRSLALKEDQKAYLLDTSNWRLRDGKIMIEPTDELVLGLKKETRQQLYTILGQDPANVAQTYAMRFPRESFEDRLSKAGLSRQRIEWLRELGITNESTIFISPDHALGKALTQQELEQLFRAYGSVPTWRLTLRVMPDTDIAALVKYWGLGGREKVIEPLLASAQLPGNPNTVDLVEILPEFARLRIDTYPDPMKDPLATREDCYYTALNFFKSPPDPGLVSEIITRKEMVENYYPTMDPMRFGDLLVLVNSREVGIHICVYLADDFVFTKEGRGVLQPWVIMKLKDVLADFPSTEPLQVRQLRRREKVASSGSRSAMIEWPQRN